MQHKLDDDYERLFPHSANSAGTNANAGGLAYFQFTQSDSSKIYNTFAPTLFMNNLDDCYVYNVTAGKYIFRGLNNPTAVNDNSNR